MFVGRSQGNTQVRLSVQYPSKKLNRTLSGMYQNIDKAVAHGVPPRIATAVMHCPPVRDHVVEKVMKAVSKEVTGLYSRTKLSLFRKMRKDGQAKFDLENVCKEWHERAPLCYSFLVTSAAKKEYEKLSMAWKCLTCGICSVKTEKS